MFLLSRPEDRPPRSVVAAKDGVGGGMVFLALVRFVVAGGGGCSSYVG